MKTTTQILVGDMRAQLKLLPDNSIDSCVCDPPYGMSQEPDIAEVMRHWVNGDSYQHSSNGFMGKSWDSFVPGPDYWREVYRVLKPGGHLLCFAATRTADLMGIAVRFAGFEIRDTIAWMYGTGFPKSLDVSKAIDKAAGAEREILGPGQYSNRGHNTANAVYQEGTASNREVVTAPATDDAKRWQGWGTALKPAMEPIIVARKPLGGRTVAQNVLEHGTGGINIDGCRIGTDKRHPGNYHDSGAIWGAAKGSDRGEFDAQQGRWPANVILDETLDPVLLLSDSAPQAVWEFYADHVLSAVPVRNESAAVENAAKAVLRSQVLRRLDVGEPGRRKGAALAKDTHRGDTAKNQGDESGEPPQRPSLQSLEGRTTQRSGIRDALGRASTSGGPSAGETDDDTSVNTGAQIDCGSASGTTTCADRGDSPPQRSEERQPAGELGDRGREDAQSGASSRSSGDESTSGGGGRFAPAVEQSAVPERWLRYFELTDSVIRSGAAAALDEQSGVTTSSNAVRNNGAFKSVAKGAETARQSFGFADSGGASRFFYTAKSSTSEREAGLDHLPKKTGAEITEREPESEGLDNPRAGAGRKSTGRANIHPTVKPISLMRYLVRLVTPVGGTVLDPFTGSGSTGVAAGLEGFNFIGCEMSEEYVTIAKARIAHWCPGAADPSAVPPATPAPAKISFADWKKGVR